MFPVRTVRLKESKNGVISCENVQYFQLYFVVTSFTCIPKRFWISAVSGLDLEALVTIIPSPLGKLK